jgi:putative hydrolase of HD superfamily
MGFLEFLEIAANLKSTKRTGWLRTVPMPESVADHSYRVALLGLFAPEGLDVGKCIVLGLCHDMAEATIGDIPTYAGVDKGKRCTYFRTSQVILKYVR